MSAGARSDLSLYRRLLGEAKPYWGHIAGVLLLSLLSIPLKLLAPVPLKIVVDSTIGGHRLPRLLEAIFGTGGGATPSTSASLAVAVGLLISIALLTQLQGVGTWLLQSYAGEKLVLSFRARLFRHVQRLSLAYHDTRGSADSSYRIQYDAPALQWIAIEGVIPFLTAAISLAGVLLITARLDRQLALIAVGITPVLFTLSRLYRRRLRAQWRVVKDLETGAFSVVQEVLSALRVVKAFGQEEREEERFFQQASRSLRARLRAIAAEGGFGVWIGLTIAAGSAGVLYLGARHVQQGMLSLGDLLMVMTYLAQIYAPLETISRKIGDLQASLAGAERAFALLDEVPDVPERPNPRRVERVAGAFAFRSVSFGYRGEKPVLRDLDFEVRPGMCVGIAGATGAGKTTLVSLLTRFYDPTAGEILLDGLDLRAYRLADLRNQFAIVLQEPVLFSTSIGENIAYARPDASEREVIEAAAAANAHEFVSRLPQGYQTLVGERGARLSGGERQRIAIARAFLKNAPVLILDEPTSSVDTETEAGILESMERLMRSRTTFIIAHRLTTLRWADLILVLKDGRIAEAGSHAELVARGQLYASLHRGRGHDAAVAAAAGSA
jgi:ATP-binding cassette subfamily B protein